MQRKVARQKKPVTIWSFATILYLVSGSLCVSYPLLAPISEWVQGSHAPLQCCKSADKLMQLYYTGLLHVRTHGNGFLDKLRSCDAFSPALPPISQRSKVTHLKNINVRGFFISLFTFISSAGSAVFSFSLLLFALGTMNFTLSLFVIMISLLVVVQCILLYFVVTQKGNYHVQQRVSNSNLHKQIQFQLICAVVYAMSKVCISILHSISTARSKLEKILIGGLFTCSSFLLLICYTGSSLLFGLEAMKLTWSILSLVALCIIVQKLFHYAVTCTCRPTCKDNCKCIYEPVNLHMLKICGGNLICVGVQTTKLIFSRVLISILLLMSGDVESNPGPPADNPARSRSSSPNSILSYSFQSALNLQDPPYQSSSVDDPEERIDSSGSPTLNSDGIHPSHQVDDKQCNDVPQAVVGIGILRLPSTFGNAGHEKDDPDIDADECSPKSKGDPFWGQPEQTDRSELETGRRWQFPQIPPHKSEQSTDTDHQKLLTICIEQNQKYAMDKQEHKNCPICLEVLEEERKVCHSHIIPKGILDIFREIHCAAADYIFNLTTGGRQGASRIAHYMFCTTCDRKYSPGELKLQKMYLQIMNNPTKQQFNVPNNDGWLQFVLAIILLRGLLVNIDLVEFLDEHEQVFVSLWRYCAKRDHMRQPRQPEIKLILATDNPFKDTQMKDFSFSLELVRRSFMFTTWCRDGGQSFLYTKFDCFHIVLPLVGCSSIGTSVSNGASNYCVLKRSELPEELVRSISSELAKLNTEFREFKFNQTTPHVKVMHNTPGPLTAKFDKKRPIVPDDDDVVIIDLEKNIRDWKLEEAKKHSPLRSPAEELKEAKADSKRATKRLDKTEKEWFKYRKDTNAEIETLRVELDLKQKESREAQESLIKTERKLFAAQVKIEALNKDSDITKEKSETLERDLRLANEENNEMQAELEKMRWEVKEREEDIHRLTDAITELQLRKCRGCTVLKATLLREKLKKYKEKFKRVKLEAKYIQCHDLVTRMSVADIKMKLKSILDKVKQIDNLATVICTPEMQDQCKDLLTEVELYSRVHVRSQSVTVSW